MMWQMHCDFFLMNWQPICVWEKRWIHLFRFLSRILYFTLVHFFFSPCNLLQSSLERRLELLLMGHGSFLYLLKYSPSIHVSSWFCMDDWISCKGKRSSPTFVLSGYPPKVRPFAFLLLLLFGVLLLLLLLVLFALLLLSLYFTAVIFPFFFFISTVQHS